MLWNLLMKKPVLTMGILMMVVFLLDLSRIKDGKSLFYREAYVPYSCKAVIVRLEKKIPENWKAYCEHNNLAVETHYEEPSIDNVNYKKIAYRRMANDFSFIAQNSPEETLENVLIVRLKSTQPGLEINAVSEGKFVAKLSTLKTPEYISKHLRDTVQVKELVK